MRLSNVNFATMPDNWVGSMTTLSSITEQYVSLTGDVDNVKLGCNYVVDTTFASDISIGMPLFSTLTKADVGRKFRLVIMGTGNVTITSDMADGVIIMGYAAGVVIPNVPASSITLTYVGYSETLKLHLFEPVLGDKTPEPKLPLKDRKVVDVVY